MNAAIGHWGKAVFVIGRRPVSAFGGFGLAAWAFVMFPRLGSGDDASIVLVLVVGLVLHGAMYGPQAAFITELFPTRIRYSGVSPPTSSPPSSAARLRRSLLWPSTSNTARKPRSPSTSASLARSASPSGLLAREWRGVELAENSLALAPQLQMSCIIVY